MNEAGSIKRLSDEVVNRIAAGEVIQRPANAVKEMLENSLDAKSSSIVITLKEGGLKFLQIQDNGSGIKKCDMNIVCERFTTSKLSCFEDLTDISTYGFRGEALASITHVSHTTIIAKTHDSVCAYKCSYRDSKMLGALKSCAGNNGTQITVEDLFYNVPMRRQALKSSLEEHRKVVEVVTRYAIHNASVGFVVKKHSDTNPDVKTQGHCSSLDNIRLLYGSSIAKELIEVKDEDRRLGFKLNGLVTNANYSSKKHVFILFINHRLVESSDLWRALKNSYAAYLPKNAFPFIYLSLEIDACNVDVNVHPTKSEVHFLNEVEVIDAVQKKLDDCLLSCNHSRTYYTQTLLPVDIRSDQSQNNEENVLKNVVRENFMVRTDSKVRKIDSFLVKREEDGGGYKGGGNDDNRMKNGYAGDEGDSVDGNNGCILTLFADDIGFDEYVNDLKEDDDGDTIGKVNGKIKKMKTFENTKHKSENNEGALKNDHFISSQITEFKETADNFLKIKKPSSSSSLSSSSLGSKRRKINLTSVFSLKKEIEADLSIGLKEMLKDSTWVGVVDGVWSLAQHSTKLYLVNTHKLLQEYMYQLFIWDFGNFGVMKLSEPASIHELCLLGLQHPDSGWKASDGPMHELASFVVKLLVSKAGMLRDYFSMQIDQEGNLLSLPMLIDNFIPPLHQLPHLFIRISTEVDWTREERCFKSVARELSTLYSTPPPMPDCGGVSRGVGRQPGCSGDEGGNGEDKENHGKNKENKEKDGEEKEWDAFKWRMEHLLYPSMKKHLLPSKKLSTCLLQVANLPDLYKVFERC